MPGYARSSGVRGFSLERFCLIGENNPIKNKKTFYHTVKGIQNTGKSPLNADTTNYSWFSCTAAGRSPDLQIITASSLPGFPVTSLLSAP